MKLKSALSILAHGYKKRKQKNRSPLSAALREQLFFRHGWGDEQILDFRGDIFANEAVPISIDWTPRPSPHGSCFQGVFETSLQQRWLPEECRLAKVRMLLPKGRKVEDIADTSLCICFPMTGDEGYSIRTRTFAVDLVKKGIAVMMLENPYYGTRRPKDQKNYFLSRVHDMLVMCLAAVEEGRSLVAWAKERGASHLGVAGVSQGGMIAGAVASLTPLPLAVAVSLAAHSPDVIFNEGLLRSFVDWPALGEDSEKVEARLKEIFSIGDLSRMPPPRAPHATFILGAKRDLVVPSYSVKRIHENWKGSQLKWLAGTHLTSIALHERAFRQIVLKAFKELSRTLPVGNSVRRLPR